jgi:hydrogenase expression/formation protein HypD
MKHVDEYRAPELLQAVRRQIAEVVTRRWTLMEICGGQTQAIVRFGLDELLASEVELVHGPGCPVCVTPLGIVDKACRLARAPDVVLCSYGDMLRVPGSSSTLLSLRSEGCDVRVTYSPFDALELARRLPQKQVVLFAIGFETTAPAHATTLLTAQSERVQNFSVLSSHVLVPPAVAAICESPESRVQGLLGPGHVCTIVGTRSYLELSRRYQLPIVITGFEPLDLLQGILRCVVQLEEQRAEVEVQYSRAVRPEGNQVAWNAVQQVFRTCDREWRGIGTIAASGLELSPAFAHFDAERRFHLPVSPGVESSACISGQVLQGAKKPTDCPAFGGPCTPDRPLGATMVSSEGACAAYYHNQRARVTRADGPLVEAQ